MNHDPESKAHGVPFSRFFVAVSVQFAAILGLFALISPPAFRAEVGQPLSIFLWTVAIGLPLSLFEYLYHRYLLHSAVLPFMAAMHRAHSTHHGLTSVKAPVSPHEPARLVEVTSAYPVEEEHQEESMMFPLWSLPIFAFVFAILIALPLKSMLPQQPILVSTLLSVTAYYCAYEVWHAVLHLPFERFWRPAMEGRLFGPTVRRMYGFHLMHHWRPGANQAIVGFWGIALWDHAFRTHRRPERMPLSGAEVSYHDAALPQPLWPIAQLDRWKVGLYKASRTLERFLARVVLRRQTR
ncbi:hypothetical protein EON82_02940 [bacterium]|nr:MAG: hypothetical protein EON82_02940 [bacterium]